MSHHSKLLHHSTNSEHSTTPPWMYSSSRNPRRSRHRKPMARSPIRPRSVARRPRFEQSPPRLEALSSGWSAKAFRRRRIPSPPVRATKYFGVAGAEFWPVALRHGRGGGGSALQSGPGHRGRRSGDFPLGARAARRRATAGRTRGHPRHRRGGSGRQASVSRWYYRQRMEATLTRTQRPWFMLIDPGSQTPCDCGAGAGGG
jgi:hypothetical protein